MNSERGKRKGLATGVIRHFGDDEGGDGESDDEAMKDEG